MVPICNIAWLPDILHQTVKPWTQVLRTMLYCSSFSRDKAIQATCANARYKPKLMAMSHCLVSQLLCTPNRLFVADLEMLFHTYCAPTFSILRVVYCKARLKHTKQYKFWDYAFDLWTWDFSHTSTLAWNKVDYSQVLSQWRRLFMKLADNVK